MSRNIHYKICVIVVQFSSPMMKKCRFFLKDFTKHRGVFYWNYRRAIFIDGTRLFVNLHCSMRNDAVLKQVYDQSTTIIPD